MMQSLVFTALITQRSRVQIPPPQPFSALNVLSLERVAHERPFFHEESRIHLITSAEQQCFADYLDYLWSTASRQPDWRWSS